MENWFPLTLVALLRLLCLVIFFKLDKRSHRIQAQLLRLETGGALKNFGLKLHLPIGFFFYWVLEFFFNIFKVLYNVQGKVELPCIQKCLITIAGISVYQFLELKCKLISIRRWYYVCISKVFITIKL